MRTGARVSLTTVTCTVWASLASNLHKQALTLNRAQGNLFQADFERYNIPHDVRAKSNEILQ